MCAMVLMSLQSFSEKMAARALNDILSGLNYLHQNGIIHRYALLFAHMRSAYLLFRSCCRDLKPENFIYSSPADDAVLKMGVFLLGFSLASSDRHITYSYTHKTRYRHPHTHTHTYTHTLSTLCSRTLSPSGVLGRSLSSHVPQLISACRARWTARTCWAPSAAPPPTLVSLSARFFYCVQSHVTTRIDKSDAAILLWPLYDTLIAHVLIPRST